MLPSEENVTFDWRSLNIVTFGGEVRDRSLLVFLEVVVDAFPSSCAALGWLDRVVASCLYKYLLADNLRKLGGCRHESRLTKIFHFRLE